MASVALWRGEKKEAKIGFAAAQMTRRKEDQRQASEEEKSNRKLGPSVQSLVGNKMFGESCVSWSRGGGAEFVYVRCLAGSLVTRGAAHGARIPRKSATLSVEEEAAAAGG